MWLLIGLFVILGMFSLVPLSAWLASGNFKSAMQASKEYGVVLLILFVGPLAVGGVIGFFIWVFS